MGSTVHPRRRGWAVKIAVIALVGGVFFLLGRHVGRGKGLPFVGKEQIWAIGFYGGRSALGLSPLPGVTNPVLRGEDVTDVPARFVADPFMIRHDNRWYMFFEVLNRRNNQGDIGLATSEDGLHWTYEQIVLDEEFHLSYPYVFEWNGQFYMIPESSQVHSVRLYRATRFPTEWSFERSLLSGSYADTSIFEFNGKWWLLASEITNDVLYLFYADTPLGPWMVHPKSPVVQNDRGKARPAGRVWVGEGQVIRFAQDCRAIYGKAVRAFAITELSPQDYQERELSESPILVGSGRGWNADGMHQVDLHPVDGNEWMGCVDGFRLRYTFGLGR